MDYIIEVDDPTQTANGGQIEIPDQLTIELEVPGLPGFSAYEIAVQAGFVGTRDEWLESLQADNAEISAALEAHEDDHGNPHGVTAAQIGLGLVQNIAPVNMPASTPQAAADTAILNAAKADATTKANAAQAAAIAAAAIDASSKAATAKQDAIAAAAADATTKASGAQSAAAIDATAKVAQAKQEAVDAAAQDATTKAGNAQAAAIAAGQSYANQAVADAKTYAVQRQYHVGEQPVSSITGLQATLNLLATIGYVDTKVTAAVAGVVGAAPDALNAIYELAAALGNDPNYAATVATQLSNKQPLNTQLTLIAALSTTAKGRQLLTLTDEAGMRAFLQLAAVAATGSGVDLLDRSIPLSKLRISDPTNLIENPDFSAGNVSWALDANWSIDNDPATAYMGSYRAVRQANAAGDGMVSNRIPTIQSGDSYYLRIQTYTTVAGNTLTARFAWYDKNDGFLSYSSGTNTVSSSTYNVWALAANTPGNATYFRLEIRAAQASGLIYVGLASVVRRMTTSMIATTGVATSNLADGAVTAIKVADNSLPLSKHLAGAYDTFLENPDLDYGDVGWSSKGANWSIVSDSANALTGSWVLTRAASGTLSAVTNDQRFTAFSGEGYFVRVFGKAGTAGATCTLTLNFYDGAGTALTPFTQVFTMTTGYASSSMFPIAPTNARSAQLSISSSASSQIWLDCMVVRRRVDSNGLLANAVAAATIQPGAVSFDKTLQNSPDNLLDNGGFESGDVGWTKGSQWSINNEPANAYVGGYRAVRGASATVSEMVSNVKFSCFTGDQFYCWGASRGNGATMSFGIKWFDSTGADMATPSTSSFTATAAYVIYGQTFTAPSGARSGQFYFSGSSTVTIGVDEWWVQKLTIPATLAAIPTAKLASANLQALDVASQPYGRQLLNYSTSGSLKNDVIPSSYTFAGMMAINTAGMLTGYRVWVTDVGYGGGSEWRWTGAKWLPVGGKIKLWHVADASAFVTSSTSFASIAGLSKTLPAGLLTDGVLIKTWASGSRTGTITATQSFFGVFVNGQVTSGACLGMSPSANAAANNVSIFGLARRTSTGLFGTAWWGVAWGQAQQQSRNSYAAADITTLTVGAAVSNASEVFCFNEITVEAEWPE